jgi:hypothetical protein
MIVSPRVKMMFVSATALLAVSLSVPAAATDDALSTGLEKARAEVPQAKARSVVVRRRLASRAPVRRSSRRNTYRLVAPYERLVAPMIMVGVGF